MTKSARHFNTRIAALLPLLLLLLLFPHQAISAATRQKNRSSRPRKYSSAETHYLQNTKPTSSILPVKNINLDRSSSSSSSSHEGGAGGSHKKKIKNKKNEFDRLNRNNKYGGPIHRESVHDAVVHMTRQSPSYDIVVMGVSSWE